LTPKVIPANQQHTDSEKDQDPAHTSSPSAFVGCYVSPLPKKSFFFGSSLTEAKPGHESSGIMLDGIIRTPNSDVNAFLRTYEEAIRTPFK
jgi:hypothetical protein